MNQRHY